MNCDNHIAIMKDLMAKLPEDERAKIEEASKHIVESYENDVKPLRKEKHIAMGVIALLLFGIVYNFTTFYNGLDLSPLTWCFTGFNIAMMFFYILRYKKISWQLDEMNMCYEISKKLNEGGN